MKNRYEALIVLNTQGKEDSIKEIVDRLESEFQKEGAEIEQVQKMDKRQFAYVAGPLDAGFYVNFVFHADPQLIPNCVRSLSSTPKFTGSITSDCARKLKKRSGHQKSWRQRNKLGTTGEWPASIKSFSSAISRVTRRSGTRPKAARFAISAWP